MDESLPDDPSSPLRDGAAQLHELLYLSYVQAGFTVDQAFVLVLTQVTEAVRKAGS